jgi:hypothetical protein
MLADFRDLLLLGDHDQVVSFEELHEAQDTESFGCGFMEVVAAVADSRNVAAPVSFIIKLSHVMNILLFSEGFHLLVDNIFQLKTLGFDVRLLIKTYDMIDLLKLIRGHDHDLKLGF